MTVPNGEFESLRPFPLANFQSRFFVLDQVCSQSNFIMKIVSSN